jgi:hypothetical protein
MEIILYILTTKVLFLSPFQDASRLRHCRRCTVTDATERHLPGRNML